MNTISRIFIVVVACATPVAARAATCKGELNAIRVSHVNGQSHTMMTGRVKNVACANGTGSGQSLQIYSDNRVVATIGLPALSLSQSAPVSAMLPASTNPATLGFALEGTPEEDIEYVYPTVRGFRKAAMNHDYKSFSIAPKPKMLHFSV